MSKLGDWLKNLFGFSVGGSSDNNNSDTLTLPGSDKPFGWDVPVIDDGSDSQPQSGFGVNFGFNTDSDGSSGLGSFFKSLTQLVPAFLNRLTAEHLTGAEREANQFSAEQAQLDRVFQERMANTQYQRGVADMQAAGVNPALAIGQGGAAAPSGQAASSVQPQGSAFNMSDIMQMFMMKPQIELMKSQGFALVENAQANKIAATAAAKNADIREGELENSKRRTDILEREVSIKQLEYQVHRDLADSGIKVNNEMVNKIAQESANLKKTFDQMDTYLELAKNSTSAQVNAAVAALRQADAAVTNAATNSYLSDYQASVLAADEILRYVQSEQGKVILANLPESERLRIDNLRKQGVMLDKQGRLIDKQGRLCTAQTISEYVGAVNDAVDSALSIGRFALSGGILR